MTGLPERMSASEYRASLALEPTAGEKAKREHPEEVVQRAVVEYLRATVEARGRGLVYAVPNQRGTRRPWEQMLLKALGIRPGIPDLEVAIAGGVTIRLELKRPNGGSLSPAQREVRDELRRLGHPWYLVRSVEDARAAMVEHGVIGAAEARVA